MICKKRWASRHTRRVGFAVSFTVLLLPVLSAQPQDAISFFETRVRPVLATNCYACHTDSALGGLRLDSRERVLKGGKSGPAVVAGKPDESLLLRAVRQIDPKLKMPMGGKLKDSEISDLAVWVQMGVPWPDSVPVQNKSAGRIDAARKQFWSFLPLRAQAPPPVRRATWPKSPLDRFILAKLEERGLRPVAPAEKRTLIRRATFDLTGLPPTPDEVEAFVRDESPDAFAKVVDRLLASPQYGVRWARHWLDIARYGEDDVRGSSDPPKPAYPNAWRYRDWVIRAFNEDLPYGVFVKAQIAADLLPGENGKLLPGLGFFGLGPWLYDTADPRDARANERNDRVDALTRGFLGLTVACARCHDHKYDPFTIQDYYGLAGVFWGTEYNEIPLAEAEAVAAYKASQEKITRLRKAVRDFLDDQNRQLGNIEAHRTADYVTAAWHGLGPVKREPMAAAETAGLDATTLKRWIGYLGNRKKDHPYLTPWFELLDRNADAGPVAQFAASFRDLVLEVAAEKRAADEQNKVRMAIAHPENRKFGAEDESRLFPNRFSTLQDYCVGCDVDLKSIARERFILWRDLFSAKRTLADNSTADPGVLFYADEEIERALAPAWSAHLKSLRVAVAEAERLAPPPYPYLHTIADLPKPNDLRIHLRGSAYNLGEETPRRFIEALCTSDPAPFRKGSGRLELAEAVASHPVAARVMVNRVWERHFGRGIVATPSNFGQLGERPSHPELLEYLATRFIESSGSVKALHREIMLSATYQLGNGKDAANFSADPENRLVWRANRRRLDVEAIRDSILFVAGNLDLTVGGASAELNDDLPRRTIYGKVSRVKTDGLLTLFDFPDPGMTSERRNLTNVPLQRLFFMNSSLVARQAEALARRFERLSGGDEDRIRTAYRILYGRDASDQEIAAGREYLNKEQAAWPRYVQALLTANEFIFIN